MKTRTLTFLFLITLLSSCFYTYYPQTGSTTYLPTQPEYIEICSGIPDEEYIVIGSIAADVLGSADAAAKHLKKKAADLGADAVIKVQITTNSRCGGTGVSGVAVKMKPKVLATVQHQ
ncbi:MAG TPA: hypothetical protein VEP89_01400 [Draconibacterium sp.]|nr:hypothetical protein [Draconibacterium sp.]